VLVLGSVCPSLEEVRKGYFKDGFRSIENRGPCEAVEGFDDPEMHRFLSDVYWWEGLTAESLRWARRGLDAFEDPQSEGALHLHDRASRYRIRLEGSLAATAGRWGQETRLRAQMRSWQKNQIWAEAYREGRYFQADGLWIYDHSIEFGKVLASSGPFYSIQSVQWSPRSSFLPRWTFRMEPHWSLPGDFDVFLGSEWRLYSGGDNSVELKPGVIHQFTPDLQVGLALRLGLHPEFYLSLEEWLLVRLTARWRTRLGMSIGRANEGQGALDEFISFHGGVDFRIHPALQLGLIGAIHRGSLRNENRLSLNLESIF